MTCPWITEQTSNSEAEASDTETSTLQFSTSDMCHVDDNVEVVNSSGGSTTVYSLREQDSKAEQMIVRPVGQWEYYRTCKCQCVPHHGASWQFQYTGKTYVLYVEVGGRGEVQLWW